MAHDHKAAPTLVRNIRPFHTADLDPILEILRESAEAAQWSPESYATLADSPGGLLLVCEFEANARLVGLLAARQVPDEAEILNIAVQPNFRRTGVASALLRAALDEFRRTGVARVYLELRESNFPARALYQRLGFVPSGRRKAYYHQPTEDALYMQKKLAPIDT